MFVSWLYSIVLLQCGQMRVLRLFKSVGVSNKVISIVEIIARERKERNENSEKDIENTACFGDCGGRRVFHLYRV